MKCRLLVAILIIFSLTSTVHADPLAHQKRKEQSSTISLLVVDLGNDGVQLSSNIKTEFVYWDIDLDGYSEATSWIKPNDAILVIDKNEDGNVFNHSELLGNKTEDGFSILTFYDSDNDYKITTKDPVWTKLYLWTDENSDGKTQEGELRNLNDYGIISIALKAVEFLEPISFHQRISKRSDIEIKVKDKAFSTLKIYNVMPIFDDINTESSQDYTLDIRTLFLPTLRGYGNLPDLHIAISQNQDLLDMVTKLTVMGFDELLSPETNVEEQFENILFHWAKAQTVPVNSRGSYINAKRLVFLETLVGDEFAKKMTDGEIKLSSSVAPVVKASYWQAYQNMFSNFIVQSHGELFFSNKVTYDPTGDTIKSVPKLNHEVLDILKRKIQDMPQEDKLLVWERYVRIINFHENISKMDIIDIEKLSDTISSSTPNSTVYSILSTINKKAIVTHSKKSQILKILFYTNTELRNIGLMLLGAIGVLLALIIIRKSRS